MLNAEATSKGSRRLSQRSGLMLELARRRLPLLALRLIIIISVITNNVSWSLDYDGFFNVRQGGFRDQVCRVSRPVS